MSNIFYTSDLHLWHRNILKYSPMSRKCEDLEEMYNTILNNIAKQTAYGDILYNLGDVSFGTHDQTKIFLDIIKNQLGLEHHLILGNHDKVIKNSPELQSYCASVQTTKEIKVGKNNIVLSHFPMNVWDRSHYNSWHLHGHSHSTHQLLDNKKRLDVGLDTRPCGDMTLWKHEEIKIIMDRQNNGVHH